LTCNGNPPPLQPIQIQNRANEYPIILVHGVLGFGREELFGFKYWGGFVDLELELRAAGYETYTAAVGPISSVWDRACELYACIKGGRVDYGEAHARRFGHDRYGRIYPGLYPQWGEVDPVTGETRKIHIIGHSLGGPTGRTLIQLLEQGDKGNKSWVCSLTTISSPHDGTTAVYRYDWDQSLVKALFTYMISISSSSPDLYYDFKLDQWGLTRRPGEEFSEYRDRVLCSDIWSQSKDTAYWDGSPEGAMELNRWVRAQPTVYYFSWATEATYRDPLGGTQVPEIGMPGAIASIARFVGSYSPQAGSDLPIDSSWWQNDGIVNTKSMDGPKLGSSDGIHPFTGTPVPGRWNYMGLLESIDHLDIVGIPTADDDLKNWYLSLAALLASLP
jgi:triacylglycerol lipase